MYGDMPGVLDASTLRKSSRIQGVALRTPEREGRVSKFRIGWHRQGQVRAG